MKDPHPSFMPEWTKAIKATIKIADFRNGTDETYNKLKDEGLDIADPKMCLIGEAHAKMSYRDCRFCDNQSFKIFDVLSTKKITEFYEWKDMIYKHFQMNHK